MLEKQTSRETIIKYHISSYSTKSAILGTLWELEGQEEIKNVGKVRVVFHLWSHFCPKSMQDVAKEKIPETGD